MTLRLRSATAADAAAIAALHLASWRSAYRGILSDAYLDGPAKQERAALWVERFRAAKPNQHVVVAEEGGEMVAFACVFGAEDREWGSLLDNLHVAPDRKGRGTGTLLIRHVAEWCLAHHPDRPLHLWVLEGNVAALQFYRALGGEVAGRARWTSPDGHTVNDLRCVWPDVRILLDRT